MFYFENKLESIKNFFQRGSRGYADCDCWAMYYWLSETFPKMILSLRDMKHGAPELPFEEVEEFPIEWVEKAANEIRKLKVKQGYEDEFDVNDMFDRWALILTRIAWCLQQTSEDIYINENEYAEEYFNQVFDNTNYDNYEKWWADNWAPDEVDKKGKPLTYTFKEREVDKELKEKYRNKEEEILKYRDKCKDEAFDLLKKYFWNLWD